MRLISGLPAPADIRSEVERHREYLRPVGENCRLQCCKTTSVYQFEVFAHQLVKCVDAPIQIAKRNDAIESSFIKMSKQPVRQFFNWGSKGFEHINVLLHKQRRNGVAIFTEGSKCRKLPIDVGQVDWELLQEELVRELACAIANLDE